jgi:hypothetical protein
VSIDDLNGWDAIVVTSMANINGGLLRAYGDNLLPHAAKASVSFQLLGVEFQANVDCTLESWSVSGGNGKSVEISIPVSGGTLTVSDKAYPLAGTVLRVTCLLQVVQSPVNAASGTDYLLQIDLASASANVVVLVVNPPPGMDQAGIDMVMLKFLSAAFGRYACTIATVNLHASQPNYPYLTPSGFDYAVQVDASDPSKSVFAIQMLTLNSAPGSPDIVAGAIPAGVCDSAVLVSSPILVRQLLLPGMIHAIHNPQLDVSTQLNGGNLTVVIKDGDRYRIRLRGAYDPELDSVAVNLQNNLLQFNVSGYCSMTMGASLAFRMIANYQMQLVTDGSTQTLRFILQSGGNLQYDPRVHVVLTPEEYASLVQSASSATDKLLTDAHQTLVTYLITNIASNAEGKLLPESMPGIIARQVRWSHLGVFETKQVLLPASLQIGGTLSTQ